VRSIVQVLAASLLLAACTSTYHPEYHPVTVSQFSQNLSYPVEVHNGGSPQDRSPVVIAPMPARSPMQAQAVVLPPDPGAPPYIVAPTVMVPPPGWPLNN